MMIFGLNLENLEINLANQISIKLVLIIIIHNLNRIIQQKKQPIQIFIKVKPQTKNQKNFSL